MTIQRIDEIRARMGDAAREAEARIMLEVLEERGYTLATYPGVGVVIEPEPDEGGWLAMLDEAGMSIERVEWKRASDGACEAQAYGARLEVWWDTQDPDNPGWAWRVTWPGGHQESGPADSLEGAQQTAEKWARPA